MTRDAYPVVMDATCANWHRWRVSCQWIAWHVGSRSDTPTDATLTPDNCIVRPTPTICPTCGTFVTGLHPLAAKVA